MPCGYVIDKERRLVLSTAWDVLTAAEALDHQNRLRNDTDFNPDFAQLGDGTRVTRIEATASDVQMLAERTIFSPGSRRAFVTKRTAHFGLLRMFQVYRELAGVGEQIQVFHDTASALTWLSEARNPQH
ncbi:MAG: hypothetical protein WAL32_03430 [Terriglobales bacterium]